MNDLQFECNMARIERSAKRLWLSSIVLVLLLVVSNFGWIFWYMTK